MVDWVVCWLILILEIDQILLALNSTSGQLIEIAFLHPFDLIKGPVCVVARINGFQQCVDARSLACVMIQPNPVCIAVLSDANPSKTVKFSEIALVKALEIKAYCFPQLVILKVMICVSLNDVLDELQQHTRTECFGIDAILE